MVPARGSQALAVFLVSSSCIIIQDLIGKFIKPLSCDDVHQSARCQSAVPYELRILGIARLRIDKLASPQRVRRHPLFDHRLEVLVYLIVDLRDSLRMEYSLAQPRPTRKPVREIPAHLLEFP